MLCGKTQVWTGIALALCLDGSVQAATAVPINFDPDGAGGTQSVMVSTFDWLPGSTLAVGALNLSNDPDEPTAFTLYSQGRLGSLLDSTNHVIAGTGLNSAYEITYQASVSYLGTGISVPGFGDMGNFGLDASGKVGTINLYWDGSIDSNARTGAGYGDGTLILSAFVTESSATFFVPFATDTNADGVKDAPALMALDNFGSNQQKGYGTVVGSGGASLTASVGVDGANPAWFLDAGNALFTLFFNSSLVTPFSQTDPTGPKTATAGVMGHVPSLGPAFGSFSQGINGLCGIEDRCDFLFQSDANNSFGLAPVPVPAAAWLLGSGLIGLIGATRHRMVSS
jgi:hypothetical protein